MEAKETRRFGLWQQLPVDLDPLARRHVERGRVYYLPVDGDPARRDQALGLAPRAEPGAGDDLGDALGLFRRVPVIGPAAHLLRRLSP